MKFEIWIDSILDGCTNDYDFRAELERYEFPHARGVGPSLNRGIARVSRSRTAYALERDNDFGQRALEALSPSTLRHLSPVVDVSMRAAGHYFRNPDGICFDAYLGVGQQLFDKEHPEFQRLEEELHRLGLIFRRESATNDFLASDYSSLIASPHDLAARFNSLGMRRFEGEAARSYLCGSGAEAVEAALKIASAAKSRYLLKRYGSDIFKALAVELGIGSVDGNLADEEWVGVPQSVPFYIIAPLGAFHGRTAGALSASTVRSIHRVGFPTAYRTIPIRQNAPLDLDGVILHDNLSELLAVPGRLSSLLADGRVPSDLVIGSILEIVQGEGGYTFSDPGWLSAVSDLCKSANAVMIVDEIQTYCRTGTTLACEWANVTPDIITVGKGSVVSAAIARRSLVDPLALGWHSSTWGGGKIGENSLASKTLQLYEEYRDPMFLAASGRENEVAKEHLIERGLQAIAERHPGSVSGFRGKGGLWIVDVRDRDRVVEAAWNAGLKLLTCGVTRQIAGIRALFLADVLTIEVLEFLRLLDGAIAKAEESTESGS